MMRGTRCEAKAFLSSLPHLSQYWQILGSEKVAFGLDYLGVRVGWGSRPEEEEGKLGLGWRKGGRECLVRLAWGATSEMILASE